MLSNHCMLPLDELSAHGSGVERQLEVITEATLLSSIGDSGPYFQNNIYTPGSACVSCEQRQVHVHGGSVDRLIKLRLLS